MRLYAMTCLLEVAETKSPVYNCKNYLAT